jgi:alanine dehydrogenase
MPGRRKVRPMRIGIPRETKPNENRVALVPAGAEALVNEGHEVIVETGAGAGSGFEDGDYAEVGARIVPTAAEAWAAELVVKVKEPLPGEWPHLRADLTLFTYLHLAADRALTDALLASRGVGIAYETVALPGGELPLLTPMSEVAGRMAIQEGAKYLERHYGGRGVLLAGVPGVPPAKVVILGGGVVGSNAARMAAGLGAQVVVLDTSLPRLRQLAQWLPQNVQLVFSNRANILKHIADADLVIGAVLVGGSRAPTLVRREDLARMRRGTVLVDVAVDQGGCIETVRPTTHDNPTYLVDGIVHYGVANMPGGVPRTSTLALTNATLPFVASLARHGWRRACELDAGLALGVNVRDGSVTCAGVAEAFGLPLAPPLG